MALVGKYDSYFARLVQCEFHGNTASRNGGGLQIENVRSRLYHNKFLDNTAAQPDDDAGQGGGVWVYHEEDVIHGPGGGETITGELYFYNCLLANNSAKKQGGGAYINRIHNGPVEFINSTIAYNTPTNAIGGGLYFAAAPDGGPLVKNCIAWGNRDGCIGQNCYDGETSQISRALQAVGIDWSCVENLISAGFTDPPRVGGIGPSPVNTVCFS